MQALASVFSAAGFALNLAQSEAQHRSEVKKIKDLKEEELELSTENSEAKLSKAAEFYGGKSNRKMELFAQTMKIQMDLARRETMRDVWNVRAQLNQTIIIIDAMMFACAFENLSQGVIPDGTPSWLLYCISTSTGLAIVLLAASLLCCFKLQVRISGYVVGDKSVVYSCRKTHHSFNDYFDCHCEGLRFVSVALFYVGTVAVLSSAAALQAPKFALVYNDNASAIVFAVISVLGTLVFLLVGKQVWKSQTHQATDDFGGLNAFGDEEEVVGADMSPETEDGEDDEIDHDGHAPF